jgi:Flp pilus assembly protein TadG
MRVEALYAARLRWFVRNEDGNMVVFGVLLSLTMMMIGGLSIDLMRQEKARTAIQQTLDRGVLAAASLNQPLDPIDVLTDYFAKAGLD